ncbi:MAG: YggT family protein [Anaerolineae bacterium]
MSTIFFLLGTLLQIYWIILLARVLLSWFPIDPYHPVVRILFDITEPVLGPLRRVLPPVGMIDFSPLVALLLISVLQQLVRGLALSF